ncbi:MAG TPA: DUF3892 domain-containing protein [Pyrinomonadaceae bacterium]|nr:DUF3892 domain-containing protein [Pyrinomonadaceae bacterium]
MSNWADYGISGVCYNNEHTHIDRVFVHENPGERIGEGEEWPISKVVSAIERNKTFVTIFKNKKGDKWRKGRRVHVVYGEKFIRTDHNLKTRDNLGVMQSCKWESLLNRELSARRDAVRPS